MPNNPNIAHPQHETAKLSRRGLFRGMAAVIAGAATLLTASGSAIAKMAQKAAGYQQKPNGDQSCANCALFKAPDSCTLVDGAIAAAGWCRFYAKKS